MKGIVLKMKIMFICTGNICRSAMAHWLFKKKLDDNNIDNIEVYSCGTYAETGDWATDEAIDAMEEYEVDLKKHRATNIRDSKIEEMDLILCATESHKADVIMRYPNLMDKVYTMKGYVQFNDNNTNINDPWGYDIFTYRKCATEINNVLDLLIKKLENKEQKENT